MQDAEESYFLKHSDVQNILPQVFFKLKPGKIID